ncbi:MAG TPA: M20 family metallopeptidase [Methylomirabilota bacterium]|nr:M20 family metallopeptidase [Methylomirabilota bacterium]
MISTLLTEAHELQPDVVRLRRAIHRQPELGLHLPHTQAAVLQALDGLGLSIRKGERLTSVVAILEGARPGPSIVLRADMDALPVREETGLDYASRIDGVMHACGHDAHVAMLVGAARLLAGRREQLSGRVVFMFQPGEEGYHGARHMLEEGLGIPGGAPSAAFALHGGSRHPAGVVATRPGPILASGDTLEAVIHGRGGHASAPHDCLDPIPVACEIVQALQTFVTRRVDAFDPAVITIAKIEAGSTRNVIPETAHLLGTIRTVSERTRERVLEGVEQLVKGLAAAHGAEAQVKLIRGYPVTVNDEDITTFVSRVAAELLGEDRVRPMATPMMGSEDFSYVLRQIPGTLMFLGTRPDGEAVPIPNHSNRMVVNETAMATGVALHAAVALRFLDGRHGDRPASAGALQHAARART